MFSHLALFPFPDELANRWVYCPTEFTDVASSRPRHLVYYLTIEPMSLRRAARPVVLTRADEKLALELAGDRIEERLTRIPNGVDVEWWTKGEAGDVRARHGLPEEAPLVVYAGGLWEHKDVATLVDAVARIGDVHLVVAGSDQGRRAEIEDRIETHGIEQRVHLVGRVSREDLRSLYHTADVFASASRNEGFGLVYLEAMACGLPLVVRSVGVIPELAEQGADLVVAEDATAFAQGIETMLTDPAEANPQIVQAYDWEAIVDRFEQLYLDVAEEAG